MPALQVMLQGLPHDLPAAVFIVLHLAPNHPSRLPEVLRRVCRLPVQAVEGSTRFRKGRVYLASPDHHLVLERRAVTLSRGPRENGHRPAVDVLFRSAAVHHGPRVIGVVLTGILDDGTAGLAAIHEAGGLAVVQDPADAVFPDMPASALQAVDVEYMLPLSEIAAKLAVLARRRRGRGRRSETATVENRSAEETMKGLNGREALDRLGTRSTFTCPDCQGPLWELESGTLVRFRCQVGHAFNAESMMTAQQDVVERALWMALGAIESRVALWRRLSKKMKDPRMRGASRYYKAREEEAERDMAVLRQLLVQTRKTSRGRKRTKGRRRPSAR